jgi:hypothetical protein
VRDVRGMKEVGGRLRPAGQQKDANLQVCYGSDGTRTRDLRRDRPVRGSRRLTTMDAESLYSCGFSESSRCDSAWLSEADFRRLLPDCCPDRPFALRRDRTRKSPVRVRLAPSQLPATRPVYGQRGWR